MTKRSLREVYGGHLVRLGAADPRIVVLEADLKESTQSVQFQRRFPERYFDMGVAEQNMVGMAAGLALGGKIPWVHSFATFISMRACEQVRTSIAYPCLNVKLVVTHAGLSTGSAGTTHHAIEDIAIMRAIPNMTVLVPGDAAELRGVVEAAWGHPGPVYIRLGAGDAEDVYGPNDAFAIGRATQLRPGSDVALVATGTLVAEALAASERLEQDRGWSVRVLQMASVKPLDDEAIARAARECGRIVTVEEHNRFGGLGSAVCEVVAGLGVGRVLRLGVQDRFAGVGSAALLLDREGLTAEAIAREMISWAEDRSQGGAR